MKEMQETNSKKLAPTSGVLRTLILNLLVSVFVVLAGLLLEYKTGLFQRVPQPGSTPSISYGSVLLLIATMFAILLFAKDCLIVFLHQDRYFREQWALLLLLTASLLAFLGAASIVIGLMPWSVPLAIVAMVSPGGTTRPVYRLTDSALLLALYVIVVSSLDRVFRGWRGLKSTDQYQREQRRETHNFFTEGFLELRRIVRVLPPLQVHSESTSKDLTLQLEPVTDSLIWKDQAKELVRLSSSSYAFDAVSGWHDKEKCWVGTNVDTGDLVFLLPYQDTRADQLKPFLEYARRIAKDEKKGIGEVIVASKGDAIKSTDPDDVQIRYETEASLLDNLVDFKDYFNEVRRRVLIQCLPDSELTLSDVYVPSKFLLPSGNEHVDSIEQYLSDWLDESGQRQLALLGEYGQGKSTATLMWVYHEISKEPPLRGRIPLLIELRGTSPRNLTPLQLLGAWSAQYNINAQALMRLHVSGRLVLIFEGFDEMALVGDVEMRLKHFRTLWLFAYPEARILITGRPNFFLDEEEMKAALGISKPIAARPFCEALRLSLFDPNQIREALRTHSSTVRGQIYALVNKNARFLELVSRPSLLHIVAVLWERERLSEKVDQLTSAYVMDLFIRHSYRRQGAKQIDSPEFMALTTLEREYFMSGIAAYMAANALPNQITNTQLDELITRLIESIPEKVSTESSALSGEITQPLRDRVIGTEYGVEHVKTDVRACGLLVDDPAAPGTFRFGHKSFMEYLFAAVVAEHIQEVKSAKAEAVLSATHARIEDLLRLPVAIDFLSELVVGVKPEVGLDQNAKDVPTAKRLFRTIFYVGAARPRLFIRMGALVEVIIHCVTCKVSPPRQLLVRTLILILPMLLFTTALTWVFVDSVASRRVTHTFSKVSLFLLAALIPPILVMMMSTPLSRRKLGLWTQLCNKIGIQHKTLHLVLGTNWIPWVREQPVDYQPPNVSALRIEPNDEN